MIFVLNDTEHKELVKHLFEQQKNIANLEKALNKLGVDVTGSGVIEDIFSLPSEILFRVSAEWLSELDCFLDDFLYMQDFEEFYEKYFTKKEF